MATKVFIANKSAHDFSKAREWGELVFITEGPLNRFGTNNMHRFAEAAFKGSSPSDYILPCALSILNSISISTFAVKHGRVNLLLWSRKYDKYVERNLVFE